jgi:hypothetical protein
VYDQSFLHRDFCNSSLNFYLMLPKKFKCKTAAIAAASGRYNLIPGKFYRVSASETLPGRLKFVAGALSIRHCLHPRKLVYTVCGGDACGGARDGGGAVCGDASISNCSAANSHDTGKMREFFFRPS